MRKLLLIRFCVLLIVTSAHAAVQERAYNAIHSGVAWFDDCGQLVSAHGAGIWKEEDRFYLFGEFKRDGSNEFNGFSCYSSSDLMNWKFERIALPVQKDGRLGPTRVGERPKVMKCPKTGEFVMFMHTDDMKYKDQAVGYATCDTVNGEYKFQGTLDLDGKPIRLWDMGVFQDEDGTGYMMTHGGNLYRLADDYQSIAKQVVRNMTGGCESPAIFKRGELYYWLGSGLTAWERNDNYYFTAKSLVGPWKKRGYIAPKGKLTWNSQTTFVLPIKGSQGTTFMYMGDRWAHPMQKSAATYVWQPLQFERDGSMSLPTFHQSWSVDPESGRWSPSRLEGRILDVRGMEGLKSQGNWERHTDDEGFSDVRSDEKEASVTIPFTGTSIGLFGVARSDGGFGKVEIKGKSGESVVSTVMESYCLYPESSLKFLSPKLKRGDYTLTVTVLDQRFFWQAKTRTYGSKGDYVSIQKVLIAD
ncbi:MAG: family 43 glycosylhydrolase [Verrucomicrobiae bacterium]|nr:family 43 glycosylhydrolase [Verrucomicrobiae bacterium]